MNPCRGKLWLAFLPELQDENALSVTSLKITFQCKSKDQDLGEKIG